MRETIVIYIDEAVVSGDLAHAETTAARKASGRPGYYILPAIFEGGLKVDLDKMKIRCQVVRDPDAGVSRPMLIVVYRSRGEIEGWQLPEYDDPEAVVPKSFPDPRTLLFQCDVLEWISRMFGKSAAVEICAPKDLEQYKTLVEKGVRYGKT